ncbi:HalOD1 output domain-containing protein [Haladaptatus halobius]|uniref:HalOD1 output domain-containing protein n=1 Tax=Haladaptatus halobius TaxID=2884875 RepID=UPI003F628509
MSCSTCWRTTRASDTNSGNFTLYDYIEPDAFNSLFAHNPEAITAVAIEIEEVIVTVWENDGLYAHVSDDRE